MLKNKCRNAAMISLFAALLLLGGCKNENAETNVYGTDLKAPEQADSAAVQEDTANYTMVQAELGEFVRTATAAASLYYPVTADLVCEKENASVREILVKNRQEVKEGEALIHFDIAVSNADVQDLSLKLERITAEAETEMAELLAAVNEAEAEAEELYGHEQEIALLNAEMLRTEYEEYVYQAEYQADQYREQIAQLEQELQGYTLKAPFDGVIDYVEPYNVGDQVNPGQVIVQMHSEEEYWLKAEDIAGNLRYNMEVTVTAGPQNDTKTYSGRVVASNNILPLSAPEGPILIRLDETPDAKELEVAVKYLCDVEKLQNVLVVDRDVVTLDEEKNYVHVLNEDMIQKRYIVPGLRNTKVIWVLDGLNPGQNVVIR